ncbi:MAG TPA: desulfoferrodoxin [bacterium (Candidatus Stahlbacteria)]|nr:desulfoferrodoxin [Candidatus Stahlbacteria bacterium]
MTKQLQVYKCEVCGNIVEILHEGAGQLVCCGQPMRLLEEKTAEEGKEKHLPVIEKRDDGILVKVGSVPHPMEEKHHIEWVQLITDTANLRRFLKAGDKPEALFDTKEDVVAAREHCNVHGLWRVVK